MLESKFLKNKLCGAVSNFGTKYLYVLVQMIGAIMVQVTLTNVSPILAPL
jgi:hypothetical protein